MFELNARAATLGDESNFDIRRAFPIRRFPRQPDNVGRLERSHSADFEFCTVGESLEKSSTLAPFDDDVMRTFAAE